jgi:hemerythrin-like domain-containing protein
MLAPTAPAGRLIDVTSYLSWDHDRLDALLGQVARQLADGELEQTKTTCAAFIAGLDRHIRLEEAILFPAFETATGIRSGPTTVMTAEHVAVRAALAEVERAVAARDLNRFNQCRAALENVLGPHNLKEERVLYPGTDRALTPPARAALVACLAAYQ